MKKKEALIETPLDKLVKAGPRSLIALLLWKDRHRNPSMAVTIIERDVLALEQCCEYQQIEPSVEIWRRPSGVIVGLVQKGTLLKDKTTGEITSLGDAITPVENNQADKDKADAEKILSAIRASANGVAARLLAEDAAGIATRSTIEEAAHALRVLSQG